MTIFYARPAEVVIGTLTFAEYSVRPIGQWLSLLPHTEAVLKKIVTALAICETSRNYYNYFELLGLLGCLVLERKIVSDFTYVRRRPLYGQKSQSR